MTNTDVRLFRSTPGLSAVRSRIGRRITDPRPLAAMDLPPLALSGMAGRSILATRDLSRSELIDVFRVAAGIQAKVIDARAALDGVVVLTAFFEPSTRTRLSFESAALRTGGRVLSAGTIEQLSTAKGESLADTGVMFSNYADLVVVRHPSARALSEIARGLEVPLVNAGGGTDEHPTQAMADWYALAKWRPALVSPGGLGRERINLGILGSTAHMRSVRSFLRFGISFFADSIGSVTFVSPEEDPIGDDLRSELVGSGIAFGQTRKLDDRAASRFDVVYQNAISPGNGADPSLHPRLSARTPLRPDAVVMHPLARLEELAADLDDTPHNLYFDQAAGAVFVRQALLSALVGTISVLETTSRGR